MPKQVISDIDFKAKATCLDPVANLEVVNLQTLNQAVSDTTAFPFWDNTDTQVCIPTIGNSLPFWDTTDTPDNIPLGCP